MPLPTPTREIALDLRIEELAPGSYLLISDDGENVFDDYFERLEDAVDAARESYGVCPSDWRPPLDHLADGSVIP